MAFGDVEKAYELKERLEGKDTKLMDLFLKLFILFLVISENYHEYMQRSHIAVDITQRLKSGRNWKLFSWLILYLIQIVILT